MKSIKDFQSNQIRSIWSDEAGEWLFSIVDVVGALTESVDASAYWRKLKQRLKAEGNQTVTNCHRLKMQAADGKMRLTDVANTEQLLRIIQSIPSPKAEPFKQWLAQLGADRIHDIEAAEALNKEIDRRLAARDDVRQHNISLADAAFAAGVKTSLDFAVFQNSGYMGLYGGETAGDIKRRKGLKANQEILDHMSSVELGANLFRITQAEDKLRRENVTSKEEANKIHYSVGRTVRKTIEELGGTMPENLPTPEESIKKLKP
jgi:DNA-damage-inducible protein D